MLNVGVIGIASPNFPLKQGLGVEALFSNIWWNNLSTYFTIPIVDGEKPTHSQRKFQKKSRRKSVQKEDQVKSEIKSEE